MAMIPRAASVAAWRGHPRPLCSHARGIGHDAQGKRRYRHETQGGAPRTTLVRCRLRLRLPLHPRQNNGFVYYTTQGIY